ncbi:hypothetical protein BH23BAC1_BH23BAC1_16100 [soil metagenome]
MKKLAQYLQKLVLFITFCLLYSCGLAPVNSSFEGARTLKKGQTEVTGNYSSYTLSGDGESFTTNRNYGLRLGFGLNDRVDLKFRYERLSPVGTEYRGTGANYLAITPKYSFVEDKISGSFTVGTYSGEGDIFLFLSPKMIFSYPVRNRFEPTFSIKTDIFPFDQAYFLGMNLGFGISPNLDKWAIRPELGYMKDIQDFSYSYLTWGVGLTINFGSKR